MYWTLYWQNLHWLSVNYPINPNNEDKQQIIELIQELLQDGIYCVHCRHHFTEWVKKNDINSVIENRKNLFVFFWGCHNEVNQKNGKEILSYDFAFDMYSNINWGERFKFIFGEEFVDIISLFKNKELKFFPKLYDDFCVNYGKNRKNIKRLIMIEKKRRILEKYDIEYKEINLKKKNFFKDTLSKLFF